MPKSTAPPSLNLTSSQSPNTRGALSPSTLSPRSAKSPHSNPGSPFVEQHQEHDRNGEGPDTNGANQISLSPSITAIPQYPPSPKKTSLKHARGTSHGFFSNLMASKSSHRLQPMEQAAEAVERERAPTNRPSRASSKDRVLYYPGAKGSATDLVKTQRDQSAERGLSGSDTSSHQPEGAAKKGKGRFGLLRQRSLKGDEQRPKPLSPQRLELEQPQRSDRDPQFAEALKTAPIRNDHRERAFGDSSHRNRSADRPQVRGERAIDYPPRNNKPGGSLVNPSSFKDNAGGYLTNLHMTGKGAADKLGKAGKGIFGRIARSGSSNEREVVTDDNYTCTTINMPLVKQTRRTRIAKRLELSKDKTEFWMPALPWRCIDYLNMNGCEEEGLYRIPGSNKDIKHWQRRFDTEHDINLVDEPELYDINTIGSMFKAWLRDLPDEILPKATQIKILEQCKGETRAPKLLQDELSKLPPFNYYLLFAITCHLSLLLSFADRNKMGYQNLCICFQPCLRIDAFCFQFLVQDWKNCWKGCWTEKEYLDEEYRIQAEGDDESALPTDVDDRATPSSVSSTVPTPAQLSQSNPKIPNLVRKDAPGPNARVVPKRPEHRETEFANDNGVSTTPEGGENASMLTTATAETGKRPQAHSNSNSNSSLPAVNRLSPIKL